MEQNNESNFDLRALLQSYLKNWYWFAISLLVFGIIGYIYAKSRQPVFSVRANLMIESNDHTASLLSSGTGGPDLGDLFGGSPEVEDEIFILSSHSVYRDVADQLGVYKTYSKSGPFFSDIILYGNEPVVVNAPKEIIDTLRYAIHFDLEINKKGVGEGSFDIHKVESGDIEPSTLPIQVKTVLGTFELAKGPAFVAGEEYDLGINLTGLGPAAERLDEEILVDRNSKKSNVVNLAINTENRNYGKDVLNTVIERYNYRDVDAKNRQGLMTQKFLQSRLEMLNADITRSNDLIQQYQHKHNLADPTAETTMQYTVRGEAEQNLVDQELRLQLMDMTRQFMQDPANAEALLPSSLWSIPPEAIAEYNSMLLEYLEMKKSTRDENIMTRRQGERVQALRQSLTQSVVKAIENQKVAVAEARSTVNSTRSALDQMPDHARFYTETYRELRVKNELYAFLLQRLEETQMLLSNATPKGTIIDESYALRRQVNMSRKYIFLIFLIVGLMIPPIVMYVRKLLRNKFATRDEVEKMVSLPVLGEMCIDNSGNTLVVGSNDTSSSAELMRLIRANLQFVLNDVNDRVVLVTSTMSGEGKSFISVNLAASLSLLGKKTLLVGMDIRAPQLANYLKLNAPYGLTQYLSSADISLDQIIYNVPGLPDLKVIVAGPVPPNPGELLLSKKVDEMFAELRKQFDYIIVDSAPIGMVSDSFNLSRISDATVYVCRANKTTFSDLRFVEKVNREHRLKKLSLVVNGTAARRGYGYGYGQRNKK